jgi:predicted  nucleic acid-binding Zn-ribbon protein|tara:strand:- start:481 stop:702 length:222 start_codon:yes stop_codon:yes gene_type:complete
MLRLIRAFFAPSTKPDLDEKDYSAFAFANKILELQERIEALEKSLSDCECRLDEKIDRIQPVIYNIASKENHQ